MKSNPREKDTPKSSSIPLSVADFSPTVKRYRVSGHESFSFRYAWFPKVVRLLCQDALAFADDDKAMVELGLGKNMVRSARFWAQAAGIIRASRGSVNLTDFGRAVLGEEGFDPYLEDIRTLWLLHWNISTDMEYPLLAWGFLFGRWQEPEIIPSVFIKKLFSEACRYDGGVSHVTVENHVDVFLHTYIATRGNKDRVQEDNLDCPLVELELLQKTGERETSVTKRGREPIYALRRDDKADVTPELFSYCIADYWTRRLQNEKTLSLRDVAHGHGGPGRVLGLTEDAVRSRLESIGPTSMGCFDYSESSHIQQIRKTGKAIELAEFIGNVYAREAAAHV